MISLVHLVLENTSNPKAVILAGAPGAGKSSIVGDIISGMNLKVMNVDNYFIKNLQDLGVSLDLKKADADGRSKAGKAMAAASKAYKADLAQEIEKRENIVIDGTAASYKNTEKLKNSLEEAGYEVFMVYVYSSLEKSLRKNQDRFEFSKGKDRSLMPQIVMQTWANVTKNFIPYLNLFGNNFAATTVDKDLADSNDLDDIIEKYIVPFIPTDTKPKDEKAKARSEKQKEKLRDDIKTLLKKENVEQSLQHIISPQEAQSKLKKFLQS